MGLLTKKDVTLWRNWFKEMAKLRGFSVKYYYVKNFDSNMDMTIYSEFKPVYSDPIDIDIIFDENPSVNTLALFGWVSENPEDKPYIARLPFDTPNLTVRAKISIPPFVEIDSRCRDFEIMDIKANLDYPDCWICRLVPIYDTNNLSNDYSNSNYNYLETDDTPDEDTPSNKNFQFINVDDDDEN